MSEIMIGFTAIFCIGIVSAVCMSVIRRQSTTIDALTDRLMVLSGHREYSTPTSHIEPEKPTRKPLSWHDDPGIAEEEINDMQ